MNPTQLALLLVIAISSLAGCNSSRLEGVEGRWSGSVACLGDSSEISLSLRVEEELIYGSAIIRTKDSNSNFTVQGGQTEVMRLVECLDNTCATADDCLEALDKDGATGKSRCVNDICTPCYQEQPWLRVALVLKDDNVQIPDPELELWRLGDARMKGTIRKFCADEHLREPQVTLAKE